MSAKININKNKGIVYDGYLIPQYELRQKEGYKYVINKYKGYKESEDASVIMGVIDRNPTITQVNINAQYVEPHFKELIEEVVDEPDLQARYLATMMSDFKKDIQEQRGLLAYSKKEQVPTFKSGEQGVGAVKKYQSTIRNKYGIAGAKADKEAAVSKAQKQTRAALRGARAAGKAATAGSISQQQAQELQSDLDGIKKSLGSGAYKTLSDGVMKKYLDGKGNVKPSLRPADARQFKQLIDTENDKLNQEKAMVAEAVAAQAAAAPAAAPAAPAAAAATDSDEAFNAADDEYEAPDSKAAAAAVAPVAANLSVGAGSAAPVGQPPRPRQPLLPPPIPQPAPPNPAQVSQDAEAAEQLRQAGLRNMAQPPPPPSNIPTAASEQQEGMTAEDRSQNISLQVSEQEKGDSGTKADDNLDVSKYGYDKQVSMFAIQEDRDFTYSQTIVKAQNPTPKDGLMEALKMWGYTIEINKPKTSDEAEALEIRTFIFLAKEKYALDRQWKRALTQLPEALDDIGFSGQQTATAATGAGQQMGVITQFADPQVFANFVNQAAAAGAGGAPRTPPPTPAFGGMRRVSTEEDLQRVAGELSRQSSGAAAAESKADIADENSYESSSDDQFRRRLTGFGRDVGYTNRPDRVGRTERVPQGGQGVQRVRVARPQQARPKKTKSRRLDTRPKMNVREAQFKLRKSRMNPNLLFTNLTKQNPAMVGTLPLFKSRVSTKAMRRIQF